MKYKSCLGFRYGKTIHPGYPQKMYSEKKMLILTFPIKPSPLADCIWNNIDITETNKTIHNGCSLTKASRFFTFLGYCTKAANVSTVAPAAGKFSPICEGVCGTAGECKMLLNKLLCDPK